MNKQEQKAWLLQNWNFLKPKQRAEALKRYWGVSKDKKEDIVKQAEEIFGK